MTNTISSTFRIASGLIAGLTIVAGGFVSAPGSAEAAIAADDYALWRTNFGANAQTADSSDDGRVDAADFLVWRTHLG